MNIVSLTSSGPIEKKPHAGNTNTGARWGKCRLPPGRSCVQFPKNACSRPQGGATGREGHRAPLLPAPIGCSSGPACQDSRHARSAQRHMPPIGSEDRSGNPPAAVDGPPNPAPHLHTAGTDSTQRKRGGGARDVLDALRCKNARVETLDALRFRNARVWTLVEDRLRLRALRCRTADRNEAKNANGCVARNRGQHRASPSMKLPSKSHRCTPAARGSPHTLATRASDRRRTPSAARRSHVNSPCFGVHTPYLLLTALTF